MKVVITIEVSHYQLSSERRGLIIGVTKETVQKTEYTIGKSWTVDDCVRVVNDSLIRHGAYTSEKIVNVEVIDNSDPLDHPELRRHHNADDDEILL